MAEAGSTNDPSKPTPGGAEERAAQITATQAVLVALVSTVGGIVIAVVTGFATVLGNVLGRPAIPESDQVINLRDSVRVLERLNDGLAEQLAARQHWLIITGLSFADPGAHARLIATVDGIPGSFPTATAWADGDAFPRDSTPLVRGIEQHQVRFHLHYSLPLTPLKEAGSAEVATLPSVPYAGEYRLYEDPGGSSGKVVARVRFEIRTAGPVP